MNELAQTLIGDSAAAPPDHILEKLSEQMVHAAIAGAPHTIYQELWHLAFWQQITLDWIAGIETPCPEHAALGFPSKAQTEAEPWEYLRRRFLAGAQQAAAVSQDIPRLELPIRCPSPSAKPTRIMTIREQLESLTAHNAYHLGRIVLLRQLHRAWPPPSGGFTW
jgi:uncharacterized damage-inducible protein DinB